MEIQVTERAMIRPATQEDIDLVEETLRDGDRAECEIFGPHKMWHQDIEDFEECWAIFGHGKPVGYCGVMVHPGQTALAPVRWLCFLSTQAVDGMKISFVKDSRAVMREIVRRTKEHVTRFISMPAAAYHGSVIWHERVLKMHRSQEVLINNHKHIIYTIDRKEVLT
jgi:hypothetical protein